MVKSSQKDSHAAFPQFCCWEKSPCAWNNHKPSPKSCDLNSKTIPSHGWCIVTHMSIAIGSPQTPPDPRHPPAAPSFVEPQSLSCQGLMKTKRETYYIFLLPNFVGTHMYLICMYAYMHACMHACMHVCIYIASTHVYKWNTISNKYPFNSVSNLDSCILSRDTLGVQASCTPNRPK